MSETVTVEVDTKISIFDPDVGGMLHVRVETNGKLDLQQSDDNVILSKDASLALARVILQHHQIGFEPVFQQEVNYL